jgi:hypothetical protein
VKRLGLGVALLLACGAQRMTAQTDECRPGKGSNEAKTMAIFDVPLAFSGAVAPGHAPAGRVQVGLELGYLPNRPRYHPTTCRPDKHAPEHRSAFAAPRPQPG